MPNKLRCSNNKEECLKKYMYDKYVNRYYWEQEIKRLRNNNFRQLTQNLMWTTVQYRPQEGI